MYFYVGEMVIGSSIDLANRRKEARGHFPTPAGIKVINKRIKSAVAKFGDYFCPLGVYCIGPYNNLLGLYVLLHPLLAFNIQSFKFTKLVKMIVGWT